MGHKGALEVAPDRYGSGSSIIHGPGSRGKNDVCACRLGKAQVPIHVPGIGLEIL